MGFYSLFAAIVVALYGVGFPDFDVYKPWLLSSVFALIAVVISVLFKLTVEEMPQNLSEAEETEWKYSNGGKRLKHGMIIFIPVLLCIFFYPSVYALVYLDLVIICLLFFYAFFSFIFMIFYYPHLVFTQNYSALVSACKIFGLIVISILLLLDFPRASMLLFLVIQFFSTNYNNIKSFWRNRFSESTVSYYLKAIGPRLTSIISKFEREGRFAPEQLVALKEVDEEVYPVLKERKFEAFLNTYYPRNNTVELLLALIMLGIFIILYNLMSPNMDIWAVF